MRYAVWVFVLLLIGFGVAACTAVDLGDWIQARTPPGVQQATGLPSKLSLNAAHVEYQAWLADVQRQGTQWRNEIERANEVRGLLAQLTLNVLDEFGPAIAGMPVLAPLAPVLTGLVGVFVGRGNRARQKEAEAREKEKSYNKSQRDTIAMIEKAVGLSRNGGAPSP